MTPLCFLHLSLAQINLHGFLAIVPLPHLHTYYACNCITFCISCVFHAAVLICLISLIESELVLSFMEHHILEIKKACTFIDAPTTCTDWTVYWHWLPPYHSLHDYESPFLLFFYRYHKTWSILHQLLNIYWITYDNLFSLYFLLLYIYILM